MARLLILIVCFAFAGASAAQLLPVRPKQAAKVSTGKPARNADRTTASRGKSGVVNRSEPETLSLGSLHPKEKILAQAASMTSQPAVFYSTQEYAAQFEELMKALQYASPSPKEWSEQDKQLLIHVPPPSKEAAAALKRSRAEGEAQVEERVRRVESEHRQEVAARLERERLEEEQRQALVAEEQKREAIAAENRKAEAMQAQAQALNNNAAAIREQNSLLYPYLY